MNTESLSQRVTQLRSAVESSANQHNALIGRLAEAMHLLQVAESEQVTQDEVPNDRNND
jgi:hypothetical protein